MTTAPTGPATLDPIMDRRIREELDRRVKAGALDQTMAARLTAELDRRSPQRPNPADTALASMGRMAARTPRSQPAPVSAPVAATGTPQPGGQLDMSGLRMTPQLARPTDAGSVIERNVKDAGRGFVRAVPSTVRQFAGAAEAVESAVIPQKPSTPGLFREMREQLLDPAVNAMPAPQEFAGGVVESLPGVGAAFLAGPAAPLVAAAQSGGAQFNDARERMQAQGATYDQAAQIARAEAGGMATFTGLTSLPVFGELARRGIPAETAKSWILKATPQPVQRLMRMMGIPLGEATQEASEEAVSMAMQQWAESDPAAFNDWQARVIGAATAGGLIGTGANMLTQGAADGQQYQPQTIGQRISSAFGQSAAVPIDQQQGTGAAPEPMRPAGGADNAGAAVSPQPSEDPNQDAAPRAAAGAAPDPAATSSTTTEADPFTAVQELRARLAQVLGTEPDAGSPQAAPQAEPPASTTAATPDASEPQGETAAGAEAPAQARTGSKPYSFGTPDNRRTSASPNVSGRPDLGSGRLNIPMDVVPPEARRAEAQRRAGVRDFTNRVLNPSQKGYSTEGSLTPGDVFPRPAAANEPPESAGSPAQPDESKPAAARRSSDPSADASSNSSSSSPERTTGREPWQMTVAEAKLTDTDPIPVNSARDGPWTGKMPPVGTYKIERNFDPGMGIVQKLVEVDPNELGITEDEEEGRRAQGFDTYVQWAREGKTPPPITVVWNQPSKRWVSTNRRRVLAARDAGITKMLAWRDEIHPDGTPVKHREAVEAALKAGKPVPPEVLADFPDLQAGRVGPPPTEVANPPTKPKPANILDQWQNAGKPGPSAWPRFTPEQRAEFTATVQKMPPAKGPIYRGLTTSAEQLPEMLANFAADASAPTSWSTTEETADTYASSHVGKIGTHHGIIWKLDPQGSDAARDISSHPSEWTEDEAVLLGGNKPQVKAVRLSKDSESALRERGLRPSDYLPTAEGWQQRVKESPVGLQYVVEATLAKPAGVNKREEASRGVNDDSDLDLLAKKPDDAPQGKSTPQRDRAAAEIRSSFGDQADAVLPIMDAYARSWASATGKTTDDFYGRFSFEKGTKADPGSLQQADGGPFFSAAERAVRGFKDAKAKMTGAQWHKWLQNAPGIKPEELEWIGLDQVAAKMTPAEAADYIAGHGVKVEEVKLGDPPPDRPLPPGYRVVRGQGRQWFMQRPDGSGEILRILDVSASEEEATQTAVDRLVRSGVMEKPDERRTKFENYQTPGGKGYRELLLTMPATDYATAWKNWAVANGMENAPLGESEKAFQKATGRRAGDSAEFHGGHFNQPNILAHVRFNERTDADGKKVLFLEEIQSDWHQKGKKHGYNKGQAKLPADWSVRRITAEDAETYRLKEGDWAMFDDVHDGELMGTAPGSMTQEAAQTTMLGEAVNAGVTIEDFGGSSGGVPDAPFKTSWPMLAMKRMMVYAAQNGFDRIAWTTGEMQADRYDLAKQVDKVRAIKLKDGTYEIELIKDGRHLMEKTARNEAELEELIGKDLARKIVQDTANQPESESPERLEAWAKVTEARQAVLEAERQVFGENAFTVHETNSDRGNWVVRRNGDDVSHHRTKEEAEQPLADYTSGFRRYDKDGVGREAFQPFEDAVENYRRVYAREWWVREERGEYPPGHPKALETVQNWKTYSGLDLKVGGDGMKGFYDQILPTETNKIAKKWGGRVGTINIQADKRFNDPSLLVPRRIVARTDGPVEFFEVQVRPDGEGTWQRDAQFDTIEQANAYIDGIANTPRGHRVHSLDVTPAMREAVAGGMPLFQGTPQDARGSYRMLEDGRVVIKALTNPNASTLPHEVAHAFLDFLDEVDPKLKADANKALGLKAGERVTVAFHERWARAFEKYLRDGIAPSGVLRQAFEQFKTWLRNIYQTIKGSPLEGKMNPGLKKVFDEMLTRGDKPSPAKKAALNKWSKASLASMLRQAYDQSPAGAVAAGRMEMGEQETGAATHSMSKFKRGIPQDLKESLEGRDDLLDMLTPNAGGDANGEDFLGQLGVAGYIDYLEGLAGGGSLKTMAQEIRDAGGDPQAELIADLWESAPKGRPAPKDTIEINTGDELPVGSRFTIDGRPATVVSREGEPTLKIRGLGEYPLVALREIPADRGSVEMFQQDDAPTTSTKIVDLATYIAIRAAKLSPKNPRVTDTNIRSALDTFTGHGKYSDQEVRQVSRMATSLLSRSKNKYGAVEPGRLEANTAKAYERVQAAQRRAARPTARQDALSAAVGVRPAPTTQEAVDRAVALERGQAAIGRAMEVRAAQQAGEAKAERLKARLSEQGRKARDEMAQERRQMRDRLIGSIEALKARALSEGYLQAQRAGEAGAKEATARLQAFRDEAAKIILKNLPRGERGRSTLVRALRTASNVKDIQRLITEVQHRAVSSRAGLAWKELRRDLKGKKIQSLPEAAKDIPGIDEGKNVREHVRTLFEQAKTLIRIARNQKAAPMKVARLLDLRRQWMPIYSNPNTTPEMRAHAGEILKKVREGLKDLRPDLAPKVEAAEKLKAIQAEIHEILHLVKHADRVYLANERKSARETRRFIVGRIESTKQIARAGVELKPGLASDPEQGFIASAVFSSMTPDTFGQWLDNAAGFPERAGFARMMVFELPLDAAAAVAEEKVKRLEKLNKLAETHGFKSFDEARAKISGTLGPGMQETVDIDVDGWGPTRLTMGEALKIFGDDQDVQTSELSDMGMRHKLDRLRAKPETTLDRSDREKIIAAIPKRYRDFYTGLKQLKDATIGGRSLEIRRRLKGSAPDKVDGREPRLRETDSDYATDIFNKGEATRSSLLERSFMKDRVHNPGPTNVIIDGLDNHMRDWDDQLHTIHHAELSNAIAKTLLHPDVEKAIVRKAGQQAWRRLQSTIDRILGVELRPRPNAVDQVVGMLKKNTGAGLTAVSPKTFIKQFSVFPMIASLHVEDAAAALRGITQKGLRERIMASNGLLAQRFSMSDAAIIASKGTANPVLDVGDIKLKLQAAKASAADMAAQLATGNVRNAAKSMGDALGNTRDAITNSLRANGWADEQAVKMIFLIAERQVDREHPNLNKADRERLIGRKTAQMVHRYVNTYDILGQAFWRGDLDAGRAGSLLNMFSNDSTKQQNLILQAAWSGDRKLQAKTTAGLTLAKGYSALAPAAMSGALAAALAAIFGSSDDEEERRKKMLKEMAGNTLQEALGLTPGVGGEMVETAGQMLLKGVGGVEVAGSPAIDVLTSTIENAVRLVKNTVKRMAPEEEDATPLAQYRKQTQAAEQQWKNLSGTVRSGGTLAGIGVMPTVNFLRGIMPAREPIGLAANFIRDGKDAKAVEVIREELQQMVEFGIPERVARASLIERITDRLTKKIPADDREARREWGQVAKDLVRDAAAQ